MGFIQIFHIILLLILIPSLKCLVLDPICQSCLQIDSSLVSTFYKSQFDVNLTMFKLPGFSLSTIVVDFRHLKQFPTDSNDQTIFELFFQITDVSSSSKSIQNVNDTIIGTNVYELQTTAQQTLMIFYMIKFDYKQFEYLLRESVSLNLSYSNNRIPTQDSSYVFVVTSQDNINLPDNKPDLSNMKNFYLQNQRNTTSFMSSTTYSESTMYWSTQSQFVVPYFPYFSNCNGQGNMMHLMQMLQNETDCQLVPLNQTQWISEFSFGTSANADRCLIKRKCKIDGDVQKTQYPDWLTLTTGLSLFQISQQKIPWQQFSYDMSFLPQDLVKCKINNSRGSNTSDSYPLKVKLSMGYYQVSVTQKRIISCLIEYDLYVPATADFTYQLQISSYPLNHTYIMLNFGFKWYVYMIVFVIIGIIGNIETLLLWFYHYFVAQERKEIKIIMYFRIIKEIMKGTTMALILQIVIIIIVCAIMNGKIFQTTFYDNSLTNGSTSPRVLFDYLLENPTKNYDSDEMQNLRSGRMGVGFIAIGVTIIFLNCKYFIGKEKPKQQEKDFQILGRIFKPLQWVRGKFLFSTFIYIILMYFFIYFAYSTLYSSNIWTFIVVMKVLQVIMQEITKSVYDDILPGLPLKIITDITSYLNTISAADLYDFLFGSLIDVAVTMIQKLYIFQIENMIVDKINQKTQQFNRFYVNLMNEQDGEQQQGNGNRSQGQYIDGAGQENDDNQDVFIYRQAQQVQFFQEQIKQTYTFTRLDEQSRIISQCKQSQQQRRLKKRYFQSLNRQYRYQRQLLLNRQSIKAQESGKKTTLNDGKNKQINNVNQEEEQQQIDQKQRQQAMDQQSQIFQILLDHMAMIYTFLVNPFVVFIIWIVYDESQILTNYGISYNTVVLYILSALVIGVFSVINIIMIFHMLENYIGMSFQEQINDVLMRFYQRRTYWKADQQTLNNSLKPQILGADHYCLSSQLFFILTVYVGGMILVIIGMAIIFQTNYNLFSDVATIPVVLFWIGFLFIFMFLVKKIAIFLNIWDYKKYKQGLQQDGNGQGANLYGVMDQKQLIKMMEQNSDFKTQNVIFAPIQQLPKFKKFFNTPKKINPSPYDKQNQQIYLSQKQEKLENLILQTQQKQIPSIKKSPQNYPHLLLQEKHEHYQIILAQKRIQTICKKLQPLFNKETFRIEYSKNNKQFIKENIQKILPLVEYLPQLQEFKNILVTDKNTQTKNITKTQQQKPTPTKRQENSSTNKNMDPIVTEMILEWLRVTQKQRDKRVSNGLQTQSKVKKCSFCYQTWGLYYGQGTTCLSCSMKINKLNKQKQQKAAEQANQIKSTKHSLLSSKQSNIRKGKKKKSTKKKNKLNIITQEQDFDDDQDQDSQQDDPDNSSGDQILNDNNNKKQHHE